MYIKLKKMRCTKLFPKFPPFFYVLVVGSHSLLSGLRSVATGCCLSNHDEILKKASNTIQAIKSGKT